MANLYISSINLLLICSFVWNSGCLLVTTCWAITTVCRLTHCRHRAMASHNQWVRIPERGHFGNQLTLVQNTTRQATSATAAPIPVRKRASKPKVRTGCTTCKIRRVKCDETKPNCKRCTSTGRKCDGYEFPPMVSFDSFLILFFGPGNPVFAELTSKSISAFPSALNISSLSGY